MIMGVNRFRQCKERITTRRVASEFGMVETMTHILLRHWLRWLGHVARMQPVSLPKQLLFGELCKNRPAHGVKRRWHDLAAADGCGRWTELVWYCSRQQSAESVV